MLMPSQASIRQHIRKRRASLSTQQQLEAARKVTQHIQQLGLFYKHQHAACYLANQGEVRTELLIEKLWQHQNNCYLPALHWSKKNTLHFLPFNEETALIHNHYGILEPAFQPKHIRHPYALDIIFMPLVAFDTNGHRIGMGGGYYDRTLNFLRYRHIWRAPKLVGLAYEFQKVDSISQQSWDIPLDLIITEQNIYKA